MTHDVPSWASEMAWLSEDDERQPALLDGVNLVLNRHRLAAFLGEFERDRDLRSFLILDVLGQMSGLPLSSTGSVELTPTLAIRPFRLWEYVWLYKILRLDRRNLRVLDLGGPASQLSVLAAMRGCDIVSLDINPEYVQAGNTCAKALEVHLEAREGDMCDLSQFAAEEFDVVISCSVLEHLTAERQELALREIARVSKPQAIVGLTFDFGLPAPDANEHLPPPHEPPSTAVEALRRYAQGGLMPVGGLAGFEDPVPGCLFRDDSVRYTVASLFLSKNADALAGVPQSEPGGQLLENFNLDQLGYRLKRTVEKTGALLAEVRSAAAHFERIAAERLAVICERDREIQLRDERIATLESMGADRMASTSELHLNVNGQDAKTRPQFGSVDSQRDSDTNV